MFTNVCCALHNVCIKFRVPFNEPLGSSENMHEINIAEETTFSRIAQDVRNKIKNLLVN